MAGSKIRKQSLRQNDSGMYIQTPRRTNKRPEKLQRHKLEQNLLLTNGEKKQCIITGDLNIDGLKIKTSSEVENFFNMLLEHNFLPTITNPTRIVNNSRVTHIPHWPHINQQPSGQELSKSLIWKYLQRHQWPSPKLHHHWQKTAQKDGSQKTHHPHTRRQKQSKI